MAAAAEPYTFAPDERPLLPGSPFVPRHPSGRKVAYVAVSVLLALAASLGNALVTVNAGQIAGSLGLYAAEAGWLPAVYVAFNASANLLLIKARVQFGIPAVTIVLLALYAAAATLQLAFPGLPASLVARAGAGLAAGGLITLAVYNLSQVFPVAARPAATVIAVTLPQLGTPLARLVPVELLAQGQWQGLHLIELALPLAAMAASLALPLPPTERSKAFEALDLVTLALFVPAMILLCGVLAMGRALWWTDTPWIGWALAAAVPLLAAVLLIERSRARPLLHLEWIGSVDIMRFAAVAMLVRLSLAEQTYGSVGLLISGGLTNDQLHTLFAWVAVAMVVGLVVAVATLSAERLPYQVLVAALAIALGAWLDSHSSNLTRPATLIWSQALIGFGAALFIGPALLYGFLRMLKRGPDHMVSFIVLFSLTQNIGGLAGSALLGSYQVIRARAHAGALAEHLTVADPLVAARLQAGAGAVAGAIADPASRGAQGAALLAQALNREAAVLAFDDVFQLVAALALLTAGYVLYLIVFYRLRREGTT